VQRNTRVADDTRVAKSDATCTGKLSEFKLDAIGFSSFSIESIAVSAMSG
jgi:hypothetical protein